MPCSLRAGNQESRHSVDSPGPSRRIADQARTAGPDGHWWRTRLAASFGARRPSQRSAAVPAVGGRWLALRCGCWPLPPRRRRVLRDHRRSSGAARQLGDELITLNPVGTVVWQTLDTPGRRPRSPSTHTDLPRRSEGAAPRRRGTVPRRARRRSARHRRCCTLRPSARPTSGRPGSARRLVRAASDVDVTALRASTYTSARRGRRPRRAQRRRQDDADQDHLDPARPPRRDASPSTATTSPATRRRCASRSAWSCPTTDRSTGGSTAVRTSSSSG